MWTKSNTAFIVIHGIGEHKPYEALGLFARGLWKVFKNQQIGWDHEYSKREKGRVKNYLSLKLKIKNKKICLDIYEYYWDIYMAGQSIALKDLEEWLIKISKNAQELYLKKKKLARKYERQSVIFFKIGKFKVNGYLYIIRRLNIFLKLFSLLKITGVPSFDGLIKRIIDEASNHIVKILKDAVIYTTYDVRSSFYQIRDTILSKAIDEIKKLILQKLDNKNKYENVIIVSHSLGTMIAYDTLCRINIEADANGSNKKLGTNIDPDKIYIEDLKRLKGFVTIAPLLDKSEIFFKEYPNKNEFVRSQITDNLYSLKKDKKKNISNNRIPVIDTPFKDNLKEMRWLNFYHNDDSIGGPLDFYDYDIKKRKFPINKCCKRRVKSSSEAHTIFWNWNYMYKNIANEFLK
jgi:hypothetical protein